MLLSRTRIKKTLITLTTFIVGYFVLIAYLVTQDDPVFTSGTNEPMSAKAYDDLGLDQVYPSTQKYFKTRNNSKISAQYYNRNSNLTIIVLHGILSSSYTNNRFSGLLREAADADVYALDLRGHGGSDGYPGDVEYIGQYEDDVADVIEKIQADKPNGKIIIAGHSMGGGISLRYALNKSQPNVDGYILFAPQLGENSPTNIPAEGAEAEQDNNFMAIHLPRLIGLALLNSLNMTQWNNLPVFFFNLPSETPVNQYSFRSSASMSPKDYISGLQAIDKPLLVVIGEEDEAFNAAAYESIISSYTTGDFMMVDGQSHNGIRHDELAMNRVKTWIKANNTFESNLNGFN